MNSAPDSPLKVDRTEADRLLGSDHHDPHSLLGLHPLPDGGFVLRAFHPEAEGCDLIVAGEKRGSLQPLGQGIFALRVENLESASDYRLKFRFADGATWVRSDPYAFLPTVSEMDRYLFAEGTHRQLYHALGARVRKHNGVQGTSFAVWAPNARRVSLIGDFCGWDGRLLPMRSLGASGVWELFVPGISAGALYKFEIKAQDGSLRIKTDPMARRMQLPPETASIVHEDAHEWHDHRWLEERAQQDHVRRPINIYELHLGSWARDARTGTSLSYRAIAKPLVDHVKRLGFTHVEFMPLAEHAYYPSWGYQVTGYYAPTSRYGTPEDLKYLVDYCHQNGVGVIVDWVPAHFPKDDFALRRFDGTALYEHEDPRRGEHPDWGTLIFNYGRAEVRSFLVANAIYWLKELHVDALRIDAVASMLYLDYSRKEGEWLPNQYGGRENIEAIDFLRHLSMAVEEECPGAFTVAEESTAWGGITAPVTDGGLGFTFKWNMGWMHDTLGYFQKEPVHRKYHQDQLTFAMIYENSERFINSISHDEVVHGKGSLIEKMPGDFWQKLANLRLLYAYQATRPGKLLMFMGGEIGQHSEWNVDEALDWHLADAPQRRALMNYVSKLGHLYQATPELWQGDPEPEGFAWIDCTDHDNSVLSYQRRIPGTDRHVVVVLNMTPVPREEYRIGAPRAGTYKLLLSTDAAEFGGSGFPVEERIFTQPVGAHGFSQSVVLGLPPLAALVYAPE
jgi:1,4-alpha-glucan branching enzyme